MVPWPEIPVELDWNVGFDAIESSMGGWAITSEFNAESRLISLELDSSRLVLRRILRILQFRTGWTGFGATRRGFLVEHVENARLQ